MEDEQLKRLYSGIADHKVFSKAQTIHNLLAEDLADFAAKDAEFDLAFVANFQTEIDTCEGTKTDETYMDEVEQLTKNMNEAWADCKEYFQDMKYYIEKAFPNDPAIHNQFGFDNYRDMSREQGRVVLFMDALEMKATEFQTQLIAAGMTPGQVALVANLRAAFKAADMAQNDALTKRIKLTQLRIKQYNKLWVILQQVNQLSKAVYRGDYAKLQQYLLPAPANNEVASLALTGTVLDASTNEPIADAVVELPALSLTTTTDDTGKYGFTQSIPAGETTLRVSASGYVDSETTVTIVDDELVEKNVSLAVA